MENTVIKIPQTKEELLVKYKLGKDMCNKYLKVAIELCKQLEESFLSNGLGDVLFEHINQAEGLIDGSVPRLSSHNIPRNAVEYNILMERVTRETEEYLGQFVPSHLNNMRRLIIHIEQHILNGTEINKQYMERKQAMDKLITLVFEFLKERNTTLLIDYDKF